MSLIMKSAMYLTSSGCPWEPQDFTGLQRSISFVTTMGYGTDVGDYTMLKNMGYNAIKGFSFQIPLSDVPSIITSNGLKSGMLWNLCKTANGNYPEQYITAIEQNIGS